MEWVRSQNCDFLFWVPLKHRRVLYLPHVEMMWDRPTKVGLCRFKHGRECIDQGWLKELEEREKMERLLE